MESISGMPVLHCAALSGSLPIVKKIIEITGKKLINKVDHKTKLTAISASIKLRKGRLIFIFLKKMGADLNVKDVMSPLMCELSRDNTDEKFVKDLILVDNVDVNIEVECLKGKENALHYAINKKMNDVVKLLLEKGAKCLKPKKGEIPDIGIAIMFLGKDVYMKMVKENRYIESTIYPTIAFAIAKNDTDLIDAILDQRLNDIECGYLTMTPLKAAVLNNDAYLVEKLLKMGANPFATHSINRFDSGLDINNYYFDHGVIHSSPPLRCGCSSAIFFGYSNGSAIDLAFMKNNENVLKIFGLQGAAPKITSEHITAFPFFHSNPFHMQLWNSYIPFSVDFMPPDANYPKFGVTSYHMDPDFNRIFYEIFNDKDTTIITRTLQSTYFTPSNYL